MKIKNLSIQGFRGFNEMRIIDFNERLTLIYAPNSYGKTSISEAFEWLFYGVTSKVEKADSKDEYKGSYRNRHFPNDLISYVKADFISQSPEEEKEIVYWGELKADDTMQRFIEEGDVKTEVDTWPLQQDICTYPHPFILQHALKYLLLTTPDERFQGFARILGLEDLDKFNKSVVSLCTAPDRRIPLEVKMLQNRVSALEKRVASSPSLSKLQKVFKRRDISGDVIYASVITEGRNRVPEGTEEEAILPQLLIIREDAVGKIFKGHVTLVDYSLEEKQSNSEDDHYYLTWLTDTFVKEYSDLIALANIERIVKRANFFDLGIEFMVELPGICPFCERQIDDKLEKHIKSTHTNLHEQTKLNDTLITQREKILEILHRLELHITACQTRHMSKVQPLIGLPSSYEALEAILVPKYTVYYQKIKSIISDLTSSKEKLEKSYLELTNSLANVSASVNTSTENSSLLQKMADSLVEYVSSIRNYVEDISAKTNTVIEVDEVLQHELDKLAGTEDVSILIDLIDARMAIKNKIKIDNILNDLKELRSLVDQFVANKVLNAISSELSNEVMHWYSQIKTSGDPDVHFDGFDMDRTTKGEIKARRVRIKAKSYGEELVSAVSSLSESKLNALGLCVSIATCLKGSSPFEFLIIDDPIQSLDAGHETQFVDVIRSLVEDRGRQVILLSHNRQWLEQVCKGCRNLNGYYYEITQYTKKGPHISVVPWEKWQERLKFVKAILDDPDAGSIRLQQAEEEIRIVVCDITSKLYKKIKDKDKNPNTLNYGEVVTILIECGVQLGLVDHIRQTFCTTDDAHHTPADYCPVRERISKYHSWAYELGALLK